MKLFGRRALKGICLVVPVYADWFEFFFVEISMVTAEGQLT